MRYVRKDLGKPEDILPGVTRGLVKVASENERVVVVLTDMGFPAIDWFRQNAPHRLVEVGIAEANGCVVASGLAAEGFQPFWYTLNFLIGRAYNQIRQCIAVDRFNVKMIFRGGYAGTSGISHNYVEDFGAMRVIPNMVIVNPADIVEAEKAVKAIADYIGPVYYRIESYLTPHTIFEDDYPFELGKAVPVREGDDATIVASGCMVSESLLAASLLEKEGIEVQVLNMSTIKPVDEEAIVKAARETGAIVTAENHSVIGGLGEAVAAVLGENLPTPMVRVGLRDEFSQSGLLDELKAYLKMTPNDIAIAVKEAIKGKNRQ